MRPSGRPLTLLLALALGFAGGATAVAVLAPPARRALVEAREPLGPESQGTSLDDLQRLSAAVERLERRLATVERLASAGTGGAPLAPGEQRSSVAAVLEALQVGQAAATAPDPDDGRPSLEQRVQALREHLELTEVQSEALREALLEKSEHETRALSEWARGESAGTLRDAQRSIQAEFRASIERLLHAHQIERLRAAWPVDRDGDG